MTGRLSDVLAGHISRFLIGHPAIESGLFWVAYFILVYVFLLRSLRGRKRD